MDYEEIAEQAYIEACELVGPNAIDFDDLVESIICRECEKHGL